MAVNGIFIPCSLVQRQGQLLRLGHNCLYVVGKERRFEKQVYKHVNEIRGWSLKQ